MDSLDAGQVQIQLRGKLIFNRIHKKKNCLDVVGSHLRIKFSNLENLIIK